MFILWQNDAIHQDLLVFPCQIEDTGQFRVFIIPQEPGVPVNLRCQNQVSVENLQDQVIFPVIQAKKSRFTRVCFSVLPSNDNSSVSFPVDFKVESVFTENRDILQRNIIFNGLSPFI